jgi:pimeloyl-ACP methyl ester carboxylesterase
MNIFFVFFYTVLTLGVLYLFFQWWVAWKSFARDALQVFIFRSRWYKEQKHFFLDTATDLGTCEEWDQLLLQQWAEETSRRFPEESNDLWGPSVFQEWLSSFPPEPLYIPYQEEKWMRTMGRDAGSEDAPTYGFLHGIWDNSYGFIPLAYYLWRLHQGNVRFIFQEMPGHGAFNVHREALEMNFIYLDLADLVGKRLRGEARNGDGKLLSPAKEVTLLGNSMGGAVALVALSKYGENVKKAVPINPGLIAPKRIPPVFLIALMSPPQVVRFLPRFLANLLVLQISATPKGQGDVAFPEGRSLFQHWHRYAYTAEPEFGRIAGKIARDLFRMLKPAVHRQIRETLKKLPSESVLLLNGVEDQWLEIEEMGEVLQEKWEIPLQEKKVKKAGHCAHGDQPQVLAQWVYEWARNGV